MSYVTEATTMSARPSAGDGMYVTLRSELVPAVPSPPLRPYVKGYLGFLESGASVRRRGLPFSSVLVILTFGEWLMASDERQPLARHSSLVRGLSRASVVYQHDAYAHGLLLDLTPLGTTLLFGVTGAELRDRIVPLDALLGCEAEVLMARLLKLRTWPRRFAALDAWLRARITAAPQMSPRIVWAWRRLTDSGGQVPISTLVDELGCSRRHLARSFGETVGLTPKSYARLIRFERAIARLSDGDADLGSIALECGYYDQAHLNRDVHAFAGVSPGTLLAQRLSGSAGFGHLEATRVRDGDP
ncbi:helix-turn-helix domain-containing protein [Streptomyces sp. SID5914]|nr:helix-turn-helix domain-containing protein [Streptomyces sp. SID5914]MZG13744.1 helix-turn-helix domain-containing protein [Streptomyces sp. SID5914]